MIWKPRLSIDPAIASIGTVNAATVRKTAVGVIFCGADFGNGIRLAGSRTVRSSDLLWTVLIGSRTAIRPELDAGVSGLLSVFTRPSVKNYRKSSCRDFRLSRRFQQPG